MTPTIKFVDGNTQTLISELPVDQASETMRYVFFRAGVMVSDPAEADSRLEVVKVVRFTFDKRGRLAPPEEAYNGFLKFFGPDGAQLKESFLAYQPGATLAASNFAPGPID